MTIMYINDGFVEDCGISSALGMERPKVFR